MSDTHAKDTYTNISDLPTLDNVGEKTWAAVEVSGNQGKKVDLNNFASKDAISSGYKKVKLNLDISSEGNVTIPVHERETVLAILGFEGPRRLEKITIQCDRDVTDAIVTFTIPNDSTRYGIDSHLRVVDTDGRAFPLMVREFVSRAKSSETYDGVIHSTVGGSGEIEMPESWDDENLGGYNISVPIEQILQVSTWSLWGHCWNMVRINFPFAMFYSYGNHEYESTSETHETIDPSALWD